MPFRWRVSLDTLWHVERRRLALWLPVLLGLGIWCYFALPSEPPAAAGWLWPLPLVWLLSANWRGIGWFGLALALSLFTLTAGFGLARYATHAAAAPVLRWSMSETVEGRVIELGRSASGAPRVLLDRVTIYGHEPGETPERVRVSLLAETLETAPRPGGRIRVYARLSPPGGPVEPGAFDFRLKAWFDRLGGIGYARTPAVPVPAVPPDGTYDRARVWLAGTRLAMADGLRRAIPGSGGAFAAAIIVGDRSAIAEDDAEALRLANLAHLLAISGLHMGILTGLVFAVVRLAAVSSPGLQRRFSGKKLAAVAALLTGAGYLALSGSTIATQRAFIMVAVALCAVLLDRPAISLRALAVAAAIVLVIRPVSLLEVGFQMSFAATAALVAGWEALRPYRRTGRGAKDAGLIRATIWLVVVYCGALLFTSLIAGLATAPYAAWHFNRAAPLGLIANLAAVPAMGLIVAPSGIVAGVLTPLGLEAVPLAVMGWGIGWILNVAHFVAALPGADRPVGAAGPYILLLITLGGLWLCIWRGRWRLLGAVPLLAALTFWPAGERRPDLLISSEARLLGVVGPEGRALSHDRSQSFAAKTWLRRDADAASQEQAASRPGLTTARGRASGDLSGGWRVELITGRKPDPVVLADHCQPRVLLVVRHGKAQSGPCEYIGRRELKSGGAIAVWVEGERLRIVHANDGRDRPWAPMRRSLRRAWRQGN